MEIIQKEVTDVLVSHTSRNAVRNVLSWMENDDSTIIQNGLYCNNLHMNSKCDVASAQYARGPATIECDFSSFGAVVIPYEQTEIILLNDSVEDEEKNSTDHGCEPSQEERHVSHAPDEDDLVVTNEERSEDFLQAAEENVTEFEDNDDVH